MTRQERNKVRVVYHWSGAGSVGALAAAIHLGFLAKNDSFRVTKKTNLPFGGGFTGQNHGSLIFVGRAHEGEEVYIFPRGKKPALPLKILRETASLLGEDPKNYYFVDCDTCLKQKKSRAFDALGRIVTQVKKGLEE